jgi:hypothetical protein
MPPSSWTSDEYKAQQNSEMSQNIYQTTRRHITENLSLEIFCTAKMQQQLRHVDIDISILTYRAFVWLLSRVYPHVYQQLVAGVERP